MRVRAKTKPEGGSNARTCDIKRLYTPLPGRSWRLRAQLSTFSASLKWPKLAHAPTPVK